VNSPRFSRALCAALLLGIAPAARAQRTALVPVSDPVYADLDRLHDLGVLDSMIVGQRPYSEAEVARLVGIARRQGAAPARGEREAAIVAAALQRIERRVGLDAAHPRPAVALLDEATLSALSTDARRRPILGSNGALVATTIDPLANRRLGKPAVTGQTLALELAQRVEPTGWLALQARERVELRRPDDASLRAQRAELLLGSARARWRNVALTLGREQYAWAQRAGDGLFLASDAPALDAVSLASDHPFLLPGVLRHVGPASGTLIVADLGPSVVRSGSRLVAYKLSVAPTSALELGATFENHFGGSGARSSSPLNRFIDFLPFIDIFRRHNYYDTTRTLDVESDKAIGADARLTLRHLGGLVIAGEWLIDDFDATRLLALFNNDASQSLAILVPRLGSPALSLELSAKHMGIRTYTHTPLENGMTTRGRLLGDELGPDAKAFGAVLRWQPSPATVVTLDGRSAVYSDARYFGSFLPGTTNWSVYKLSSRPNELRERMLASVLHHAGDRLDLTARAGAERIRNARFYGPRHDYVVEIGVRVRQ
jgi:hypothetical protein